MDILYYYTTAETMKYILTQGDIFATHISYMNDSEEYVNGLRELREVFSGERLGKLCGTGIKEYLKGEAYEEALKDIPEIYSISFSKEADLLSQWYMYARESGVRLGMLFSGEKQIFQIKQKDAEDLKEPDNSMRPEEASLKNVHYFTRIGMSPKEYADETESIIQMVEEYAKELEVDDFDANVLRLWKGVAPYIKNYEFRQEKEVRLVFNANISGRSKGDVDLIEYRNANGVLIPYLDVYSEKGWPVVEIMVGPGRNQERVFRSICHFVENNKLKVPKIDQKESMRSFMGAMYSYQVSQDQIEAYCDEIEKNVVEGKGIITYKSAAYEMLKKKTGHEMEYLDRNYYSDCGIIVRKSNAPYVFS